MNLIITDSAIAETLGIEESFALSQWNLTAHSLLLNELSCSDFLTHTVTSERVKPFKSDYIILKDFPVTAVTAIKGNDLVDDTYFTGTTFYLDPQEIRRVRAKNASNEPLYFCNKEYLITYTAGYATVNAVPSDLKNAIASIVSLGLVESEDAQGVKSKKLGDFSITYEQKATDFLKKSLLVQNIVSKYGFPL